MKKPIVLIVDPDTSYQSIMKDLLSQKMEVESALNAREALEKCWEQEFNLIISEIELSDMDSSEFIEKIKRKMHNTMIVVITASATLESAVKAVQLGAIDFITKPFSVEQIALLTEKFLSLSANQKTDYNFVEQLQEEKRKFILPTDFSLINPFINDIMDMINRLVNLDRKSLLSIRLSLYEMIMNAMEHGNLEIDYHEKKDLLDRIIDYHKYLLERASSPPFSERKVLVTYHYKKDNLRFEIEDEGRGFKPDQIPVVDNASTMSNLSGRGIFITKLNVDSIEYNDKGNKVVLLKRLS